MAEKAPDKEELRRLTPDKILFHGLVYAGFPEKRQKSVRRKKNLSRFRSHYSADPVVYSVLWEMLQSTDSDDARISFEKVGVKQTLEYFFMTIHYLSCYPTENEGESKYFKCDRTIRNWLWNYFIPKIGALKPEVICWPDSFGNPDKPDAGEPIWILTVDGVHCSIEEPPHENFSENTIYYSHKYNGAGLDYEIAMSIFTQDCIWAIGPYPAGKNDISVFRHKLKQKIEEARLRSGVKHRGIADRGYRGERDFLSVPSSQDTAAVRDFKARALSRHETFNGRLKNFDCLDERFRHGIEKHKLCFDACVVICQLQLETASPLFAV